MSYTAIAKQNELNRQKAAVADKLQQDMQQQKAVDVGIAQGKNQLLQEIQARADAEAAYNNAPLSQSAYATSARQGQEVTEPSYYDTFKNFLSGVADSAGNVASKASEGLSGYFAGDAPPPVAAREQAEYQAQQDMAAQEADRLKYYTNEESQ